MYVCMYVCMYIYIYIYIEIDRDCSAPVGASALFRSPPRVPRSIPRGTKSACGIFIRQCCVYGIIVGDIVVKSPCDLNPGALMVGYWPGS